MPRHLNEREKQKSSGGSGGDKRKPSGNGKTKSSSPSSSPATSKPESRTESRAKPESKTESKDTPSSSSAASSSPQEKEVTRKEKDSMRKEKEGAQKPRSDKSSSQSSETLPSSPSSMSRSSKKEGNGNRSKDKETKGKTPPSSPSPPLPPSSQPLSSPSPSPIYAVSTVESFSGKFKKERSEKSRVDGELTVSTLNAAEVANDNSARGAFSTAIGKVAGTESVSITLVEPFRRLRAARRNTQQQQRLRIGFSIDAANRKEADRISSKLKKTSTTSWTAEIGAEMMKTSEAYSMVVLEVRAAPAKPSVAPTGISHEDDEGSSMTVILVIALASGLVFFAAAVTCFLCIRPTMTPTSTRLKVVDTPPVTHVMTNQMKPTVTTASKPATLQRAWSDASTDASSTLSRSGESFFSMSSERSIISKASSQLSQHQTTASSTHTRSYTQHPVVTPTALVAQTAPIGRVMQMQQAAGSARRVDMPRRSDSVALAPRPEHSTVVALTKRDVYLPPRVSASSQSYTPQPKSHSVKQSLQRGAGVRSTSGPPTVQRR